MFTDIQIEDMSDDEILEEVNRVIREAGIEAKFRFIPFCFSRNSKEGIPSLNWKVLLRKNGKRMLSVDYTKGCGHCTAPSSDKKGIEEECNSGEWNEIKVKDPTIAEVMCSLALDSSIIDYEGFDEWARVYGYDSDSRKAEKIYFECLKTAQVLMVNLGLETLRYLQSLCYRM